MVKIPCSTPRWREAFDAMNVRLARRKGRGTRPFLYRFDSRFPASRGPISLVLPEPDPWFATNGSAAEEIRKFLRERES